MNTHPLPLISVIVPVRNEAASIERTLRHLTEQDYDSSRWEILVVDGESCDATVDLARQVAARHSGIRVFTNPRRLSSAARNIGIRNARGDVVVVVDGHCEIADKCYLRKLAAAFAHSGADCIGRPQPLDASGATMLQRAIAAARSSCLGHHPASHIYSSRGRFVPAKSVAVAYRRCVFSKVGYFDEKFDACEDVELNHRIDRSGLRCYFAPELAVRYIPRANLSGLFFQMMRYGRGRVRLLSKHPTTMSLGILPPLLLVAGSIGGMLLAFAASWLATVYLASIASYAIVVLVVSTWIAARLRSCGLFLCLPPVFFAIHFGAGLGMLLEVFAPKHRPSAGTNDMEAKPC